MFIRPVIMSIPIMTVFLSKSIRRWGVGLGGGWGHAAYGQGFNAFVSCTRSVRYSLSKFLMS